MRLSLPHVGLGLLLCCLACSPKHNGGGGGGGGDTNTGGGDAGTAAASSSAAASTVSAESGSATSHAPSGGSGTSEASGSMASSLAGVSSSGAASQGPSSWAGTSTASALSNGASSWSASSFVASGSTAPSALGSSGNTSTAGSLVSVGTSASGMGSSASASTASSLAGPACVTHQDCNADAGAGGPWCSPSTGHCVQCLTTAQCPNASDCCAGQCVPLNTPLHCGTCDQVCSSAGGLPLCNAGQCIIACNAGHLDCNGDPADGCEVDITRDPNHCGSCTTVCPTTGGTAVCNNRVCGITCDATHRNCNNQPQDGCEIVISSDVNNCGACGAPCITPNATPSCINSNCGVVCNAGFSDCNNQAGDGCEVHTETDVLRCGDCTHACSINHGTPTCSGSLCGIQCFNGWSNCNGSVGDGCEADLNTDVRNCGTCGRVCSSVNGTPLCGGGNCGVLCNNGFRDCNGMPIDGCEINIAADPLNCNGCGVVCPAVNGVPFCANFRCGQNCNTGFADCNNMPQDGCEVLTASDVNNCGMCGRMCSNAGGAAQCLNGQCDVVCDAVHLNCNRNAADGCEVSALDDNANCGMCGRQCAPSTSCKTGNCMTNLGQACTLDAQCGSGHCAVMPQTGTKACVLGCASPSDCTQPNTACIPVATGSAAGACLPHSGDHCKACLTNGDCAQGFCDLAPGDTALACHVDCSLGGAAACPSDYTCQSWMGVGGTVHGCVPNTFICTTAVGGYCDLGPATQACTSSNAAGSCAGVRACNTATQRYAACGASMPTYLPFCGAMNHAGCSENVDPLALTSVTNCGACGVTCPGIGSVNANVACVYPLAQPCSFTCQGDHYDVDGNSQTGCEVVDPTVAHLQSLAVDLGTLSSCDAVGVGGFNGQLVSDLRQHASPAVVGFDGITSSAPDWWRVTGTDSLFCTRDISATITTHGGVTGACYRLTALGDASNSILVSGNGSATLNVASSAWTSAVYFRVDKVCATAAGENVSYTVNYHL